MDRTRCIPSGVARIFIRRDLDSAELVHLPAHLTCVHCVIVECREHIILHIQGLGSSKTIGMVRLSSGNSLHSACIICCHL